MRSRNLKKTNGIEIGFYFFSFFFMKKVSYILEHTLIHFTSFTTIRKPKKNDYNKKNKKKTTKTLTY